MAKNGAGYDPAIEDVPTNFYEEADTESESDIEELDIAEAALVEKNDAWFVHVKFTRGDAKEYTLAEYNKMIPIPIIPPHELPTNNNTNG